MTDDSLPDVGHVSIEIIDGLRVRLARSGRADGVPVLFTSPWPESLYAFHRVLLYFVGSHPVIAIDLPGYGASESRPEIMSPRTMGAFLVKLAAYLNIERVHGVGPDVGALASLFAALDHPELFESLAVGGAATQVDLAAGALKDMIASPPGTFAEADGAAVMSGYLTQAAQITPPAVIEDFRRTCARRRLENAVHYVRAYQQDLPALAQRLAQIQTPVSIGVEY